MQALQLSLFDMTNGRSDSDNDEDFFGTTSSFTFIDLFAGIGGFRIAIDSMGGMCTGFSEVDKHCVKTYLVFLFRLLKPRTSAWVY